MDYMKEHFLQSLSSRDTSMKSSSSTQSEEEQFNPLTDENEFTVLAGESQDPNDDPTNNEPNFGDFWDSVTEMIADKLSQDKTKGKGKAD